MLSSKVRVNLMEDIEYNTVTEFTVVILVTIEAR